MDRWILALLAGLVGGVGGTLAVRALFPEPAAVGLEPSGDAGMDARLARMEKSLASLEARGPLLEGVASGSMGRPGTGGTLGTALTGPEGEAFKQALRAELGTVLDARIEKLRAAAEEGARMARAKEPDKKRVSLADASRELSLTAQQEDELRRIYGESQEKMIKLAAGENGDVEAVRRDLDEAKRDPKKRSGMMMKYMPRMLPKLGELIQVQLEQQAAVQEALGPDKAERLEREFDVIEANPLGSDGQMSVGASVRDR